MTGTLELNLIENESYFNLPYSILGEECPKMSLAELFSLAKIASFSRIAGKPNARCRSKMSEFSKNFHITERHSSRVVNKLIKADLVERVTDESGKTMPSLYKYIGEKGFEEGSIRIDVANLLSEFWFKADKEHPEKYKRYLTTAEVLVLSYIASVCDFKSKNKFTGSYRKIAAKLKLAVSTVGAAIRALLKAELLFCPKEDQSVNGWTWSCYRVNEKLMVKTRREEQKQRIQEWKEMQDYISAKHGQVNERKAVVFVSPEIEAVNAKAERERYYSRLREKDFMRREQIKSILDKDEECKKANRRLQSMEIDIAKAELKNDAEMLRRLECESEQLKKIRKKRMVFLGILEEDLLPRYICIKCRDTGFERNGQSCDCYNKGSP